MSEQTPVDKRHVLKHKRLNLNQKINAVHAVMVKNEKHADVAKELRVRPNVVTKLVVKAKKKHRFLEELLHKQQVSQERNEAIKDLVKELVSTSAFIKST